MTPLEARTTKGMTQAEAAALLNISDSYLSQLENGLRRPSLETMEKFSDFYNGAVKLEDWAEISPIPKTRSRPTSSVIQED